MPRNSDPQCARCGWPQSAHEQTRGCSEFHETFTLDEGVPLNNCAEQVAAGSDPDVVARSSSLTARVGPASSALRGLVAVWERAARLYEHEAWRFPEPSAERKIAFAHMERMALCAAQLREVLRDNAVDVRGFPQEGTT